MRASLENPVYVLFQSTLRKELARSFGATLVVLLTIVMTMMLIRVLAQTTRGAVNPSEVMVVMGYTVLGQLATILALSLFISIVSTISRMYRDSEMVIWFSSGVGLAGFVRPLVRFAWPVLMVIVALALVVYPWTNQQTQDMKERFEKRGDLERVSPGQFQESAAGNRVFFIDKASPDEKTGKNIFIAASENGKEAITSAQRGYIESMDESRFLMLQNGQRLENNATDKRTKISHFEEYGTRIGASTVTDSAPAPTHSLSTRTLLKDPSKPNLGQLAWRIGLGLAAINFIGLALAASTSNPRVGRSGNLMFAIFAFILYYNLLNLGQTWIALGKVEFSSLLLGLHGSVFVLVVLWVTKLHFNWSIRYLLPSANTTSVATRP
jgi:lipopolysaccharide export system permease protein